MAILPSGMHSGPTFGSLQNLESLERQKALDHQRGASVGYQGAGWRAEYPDPIRLEALRIVLSTKGANTAAMTVEDLIKDARSVAAFLANKDEPK